ncbi:hypothetical protein FBU30_004651 [Linnemannia zychae]|nr:hypothetical protein FBU30_004651 [Linnemannia zychae]
MASSSPSNNKKIFRLHGVNVLNKNDVDSTAKLTVLEKRRAAHINDERQRRDMMNQLMAELGHLAEGSAAEVQAQLELEHSIPNPDGSEKRAIVKSNSITTLRNAIAEIHRLRKEIGLKRLASYKEVLVSYRPVPISSSSSAGSQTSRRKRRPETTDLFASTTISTPPPYSHKHHQEYHQSDYLQSKPTVAYQSHPYPSVIPPDYHCSPPLSSPPLFSNPEALDYQSTSSSLTTLATQQRPDLHLRQQPHRQRIYLPWCSHLASAYPPIMRSTEPTNVSQPQSQLQRPYRHYPSSLSPSSSSSSSSSFSLPPHYNDD